MNAGVLFPIFGADVLHSIHLIVAVFAIRKHYSGPVVIAADRPSLPLAQAIASDIPGVEVVKVPDYFPSGSRGKCLLAKTLMPILSPFDRTVMLDCDTLAVDNFDLLFPRSDEEIVATNWSVWDTRNSCRTRKRLWQWSKAAPELFRIGLSGRHPAVNSGVLGFGARATKFLRHWRRVAARKHDDEMSLQLLLPLYPVRVLDWRYNASVVYDAQRAGSVKIWHGHGGRFWTKDAGRDIWAASFMECLLANVAGICSRQLPATVRYLPKALRRRMTELMVPNA